MGGAAGIARGETFFDFVDEVFDDDGVYGVAVEVERVGVEPHVFGDVEELRFGDFRWHAFMRAERHDGVDFVVCPLVDAAAQGESGFAFELVSDVVFGNGELVFGAREVPPAHDFCRRVEERFEDEELEFCREPRRPCLWNADLCVNVFLIIEPFIERCEFDADAAFLDLIDDEVVGEWVAADVDFAGDEDGGEIAGAAYRFESGGGVGEELFEPIESLECDFACGSGDGTVFGGLSFEQIVEFIGEFFVESIDGTGLDFGGSRIVAHREQDVGGDEAAIGECDGSAGNAFEVIVVGGRPNVDAIVEPESLESNLMKQIVVAEAAGAAPSGHEKCEFALGIGVFGHAFDERSECNRHGDAFFSRCIFAPDGECFSRRHGHGLGFVA